MRSTPVKPPAEATLGASPFFGTPSQRVALARERFFEEGHRPSGLVPEGVIQSWTRCVSAHRAPHESITFDPLTRTRISHTLARNRQLLEASGDDLLQLESMLAGTACKAILTDRHGVVVHATRTGPSDGITMRLIGRVGVDLAEETVGTTAPGVAAKTGALCTVQGAEHFFSDIHTMQCAAAPIRDAQGELAGVLDLSCEAQPFRFDAAAIVSLYATAIENRLLMAQSQQHVLLQCHYSLELDAGELAEIFDEKPDTIRKQLERARTAWREQHRRLFPAAPLDEEAVVRVLTELKPRSSTDQRPADSPSRPRRSGN